MKYPAQVYLILTRYGKTYVGLSHDPKKRFARHECLLRLGKHPVEDLQTDYDKDPDKYLKLVVMAEVKTESERFKEHRYQLLFRSYERGKGYNYKDPTARTEMAKAEQRKRVKSFLKSRITRKDHTDGRMETITDAPRLP